MSAGPRFAVGGLPYPHPCPTKLTWKYNSTLTYIWVSFCRFCFLSKTLFWLGLKIGLGLGLGRVLGLGLGLGFGFVT